MSTRHTLATLYGVGLCGFAPGTAGSAVAAVLAYGILLVPYGFVWLPVLAGIFTYLGTHSATRYMRENNCEHDPGEIIVDELAGQWFTYSIFHVLLIYGGVGLEPIVLSPVYLVAGFFLFRLFDIVKPWPIRWADKNIHGGFGVMFDDLLAAIPAGVALYGFYEYMPVILHAMGMDA